MAVTLVEIKIIDLELAKNRIEQLDEESEEYKKFKLDKHFKILRFCGCCAVSASVCLPDVTNCFYGILMSTFIFHRTRSF